MQGEGRISLSSGQDLPEPRRRTTHPLELQDLLELQRRGAGTMERPGASAIPDLRRRSSSAPVENGGRGGEEASP
jgi:hypothetical protein